MARYVPTLVAIALAASAAPAAAAPVTVRVEGASSTIFEGPVDVGVRNVQSLSERASGAIRKCDGTNGGASGPAAATATSAAVDAMSILGLGFDGKWYSDFDDYLISRFGNERSSNWGLYVDGAFSQIGGCQSKPTSSVTWLATGGAPLNLGATSGTVGVSHVSVKSNVAGAAYFATADGGVQQELGNTDTNGAITVTLPASGWQRIKVRSGNRRSNRVEACASDCAVKPADLEVRTPPPPVFYGPGGSVLAQSPQLAATTTPLRTSVPTAGTSGYRKGRIAVRFRVLQEGVGLLRWTMVSRDLTGKAKRYVTRARGTTATSASLALPAGRVFALRFTATDRMLNDTTTDFAKVLVPIDERSKRVRRSGPWRKSTASTVWKGTLLRGTRGAKIVAKLAAGRPAIVLRGRGRATLRVGSKLVRVPARAKGSRLVVYAAKRKRAGAVRVTVLRGTVDLDGMAAAP